MDYMQSVEAVKHQLEMKREAGLSIGFVPTMGAIHEGHLRLLDICLGGCDVAVTSIFVNPLQFNNPEDYKKYPSTLDRDRALLESRGCHILFHPTYQEVYPEEDNTQYDFGPLEQVMEGRHRPGHFNGVAVVVKRLFDIIQPHKAYFGEKDFQQLLVVQELVRMFDLKIDIVPCPIVREADGLAMSSRNLRLSGTERKTAGKINRILQRAVERSTSMELRKLKAHVLEEFQREKDIRIEYVEFASTKDLQILDKWPQGQEVIICIAAYVGQIRLIDNMRFFSTFAE